MRRHIFLAAAIVGIIAGGFTVYGVTQGGSKNDQTHDSGGSGITSGPTITDGPPGQPKTTDTPPSQPAPAAVGLSELRNAEDVEFSVDAEYGTTNINGVDYTDSVTGLVYPDDSGFSKLTIKTKRRFGEMKFAVGIDSGADCPRARARVSVEDEGGRPLWGPRPVSIDSAQRASVALPRPVQVNLVQHSLEGAGACGNGEAQVSWGGVKFLPGA
jgi:hypothetical protein